MRILQIIDSLDIGGAEKMAINYANSLANTVEFSGLVATRKEGNLKNHINENVHYLFLNKTATLDLKAILKLRKYCKNNNICHLQAHSSSFFTAFLVKLSIPKIKIIWHDHNGLSEFISNKKALLLQFCSLFFAGIIVVNYQLKNWAEKTLHCNNCIYLPNYTLLNQSENKETVLLGNEGKKILCLANFRFQKNHFLLIEVAKLLKDSHPDWSFHLVGKDFEDDYSQKVKAAIIEDKLEKTVFIYGSRVDTQNIITQSNIAILTSQSEGLPVALLEYGLNKKPVVSTKVGEIPLIIQEGKNGFIVDKYDANSFYKALVKIIEDIELGIKLGNELFKTISENNSEHAVINKYISWIQTIENAK